MSFLLFLCSVPSFRGAEKSPFVCARVAPWDEGLMLSTSFWCPRKIQYVYSICASMYHLGKTEESLTLYCQIGSYPCGRPLFYLYF